MTEEVQYVIVGLTILLAVLWILRRIFRKSEGKASDTCCHCPLAEKCGKTPGKECGK